VKEIVFLNQNVLSWKNFESLIISNNSKDADLIADAYIKLTDDLSFAQTYFPGSETEKYLNFLASKFHQDIYKTKKEENTGIFYFWKNDFPLVIYSIRKQILYSFIIFAFAVLLGVVSTENDISFTRIVLGNEYVNMTIENIKNGNPMAVYKQTDSLLMFLMIAQNNLKVMTFVFVFGMLTPIGTGFLIVRNGIMVGAFQYFFYKFNVLPESVSAIWLHGTIEMFTLIVAGGAGIMLGNSIIAPKTFSRKQSLIYAGKNGIKVIIGLSIFIVFAAFIESFFTRHTEWPYTVKFGIIIASAVLILWYFFIYPKKVYKKSIIIKN